MYVDTAVSAEQGSAESRVFPATEILNLRHRSSRRPLRQKTILCPTITKKKFIFFHETYFTNKYFIVTVNTNEGFKN